MKIKLYIFIFIVLQNITINCQDLGSHYYGKGGLGHLEFISDSLCTISFLSNSLKEPLIDTAYYHRNGDTIFISTKIKSRYEIKTYDKPPKFNCNDYAIIKNIFRMQGEKIKIFFELAIPFDTITNELYFEKGKEDFYIYKHPILYYKGYHRLCFHFLFLSSRNYNIIKLMNLETNQSLFLNEFPLIIKHNKLKPPSKKYIANWIFWRDNGLFFPKMIVSKKQRGYKTIYIKDIALEGIPTSVCLPENEVIMQGENGYYKKKKFKIKPKYNPD